MTRKISALEYTALLFFFVSVFLFTSLLFYDPAVFFDDTVTVHPREISYHVASSLYRMFGFPSFFLVIFTTLLAGALFFQRAVQRIGLKIFGAVLFVFATSCMAGLIHSSAPDGSLERLGTGGIIGARVSDSMLPVFGPALSYLLLGVAMLAGFLLATDWCFYSWFAGSWRPRHAEPLERGWIGPDEEESTGEVPPYGRSSAAVAAAPPEAPPRPVPSPTRDEPVEAAVPDAEIEELDEAEEEFGYLVAEAEALAAKASPIVEAEEEEEAVDEDLERALEEALDIEAAVPEAAEDLEDVVAEEEAEEEEEAVDEDLEPAPEEALDIEEAVPEVVEAEEEAADEVVAALPGTEVAEKLAEAEVGPADEVVAALPGTEVAERLAEAEAAAEAEEVDETAAEQYVEEETIDLSSDTVPPAEVRDSDEGDDDATSESFMEELFSAVREARGEEIEEMDLPLDEWIEDGEEDADSASETAEVVAGDETEGDEGLPLFDEFEMLGSDLGDEDLDAEEASLFLDGNIEPSEDVVAEDELDSDEKEATERRAAATPARKPAARRRKKGAGKTRRPRPGGEDGSSVWTAKERELYESAVKLILENGKGSIAFLQRQLEVGRKTAREFIDRMSEDGILTQADGPRPRTPRISLEEWEERRHGEEA